MNRRLLFFALASLTTSPLSAQTKEAFDKLRSLSGNWEGTFAWSGARDDAGKMGAQYYITGMGSAVVENLISDGVPIMTSVYHLDGTDLRMTHFCGSQNQPRLKASAIDPDGSQIAFSFVDITNLRTPETGHVEGLEVRLLGRDHLVLKMRYASGGKKSDEVIDLRRTK